MCYKKNAAVTNFLFGLVNATDGTALTGATPTVKVSVDGAATSNATGIIELSDGLYHCDLSAAQMNGDQIGIAISATNAVFQSFSIHTDTKVVSDLRDPSSAASAADVWDALESSHQTVDTFGDRLGDSINSLYARIGTPVGINLSDDVNNVPDAVWDEEITVGHTTAETAGAKLNAASAGGDPWDTTLPGAYAAGKAGNLLGNMVDLVWDEDQTLHTVSPSAGYYITQSVLRIGSPVGLNLADDINNVPNRVWDENRTGHTGANTFGLFLDAQVSTVGGGSITVQNIVDGVWDELTSGHAVSGSFGEANGNSIGSVHAKLGTPVGLNVADDINNVPSNVWSEPQVGYTTAGTFGNNLDVIVSTIGGGAAPTESEIRDFLDLNPVSVNLTLINATPVITTGDFPADVKALNGYPISGVNDLGNAFTFFFDVALPTKNMEDVGSGGISAIGTIEHEIFDIR